MFKSFFNSPKVAWGVALIASVLLLYLYITPKVVEVEKVVEKEVIKEVVTTKKELVAQVAHKESAETPDVVCNSKDSLKVSVNGKTVNLKPQNSEKFEFGKDYLKLNQETTSTLNINYKPLEPTFSIGVGYSENKKLAGMLSIRYKHTPFSVWGVSDGKTNIAGIMINANYK